MRRRKRDEEVTQKIDLALLELKQAAERNKLARETLAQIKEDSGRHPGVQLDDELGYA